MARSCRSARPPISCCARSTTMSPSSPRTWPRAARLTVESVMLDSVPENMPDDPGLRVGMTLDTALAKCMSLYEPVTGSGPRRQELVGRRDIPVTWPPHCRSGTRHDPRNRSPGPPPAALCSAAPRPRWWCVRRDPVHGAGALSALDRQVARRLDMPPLSDWIGSGLGWLAGLLKPLARGFSYPARLSRWRGQRVHPRPTPWPLVIGVFVTALGWVLGGRGMAALFTLVGLSSCWPRATGSKA